MYAPVYRDIHSFSSLFFSWPAQTMPTFTSTRIVLFSFALLCTIFSFSQMAACFRSSLHGGRALSEVDTEKCRNLLVSLPLTHFGES